MATLDTSRVLRNPRFRQGFAVERTKLELDEFGEVQPAQAPQTITGLSGIITAAGQDSLDRDPDGSKRSGSIQVITKFRLQDGASMQQDGTYLEADVVVYAGRRHVVVSVDDYTRLGSGWVIATCRTNYINPPAPVGSPTPE